MLKNLDWLPAAPTDFRERLTRLKSAAGAAGMGEQLVELANTALDETQLQQTRQIRR